MEKLTTKNVLNKLGFLGAALVATVDFLQFFASSVFALGDRKDQSERLIADANQLT